MSSVTGLRVQAETIDLKINSENEQKNDCPNKFSITEKAQPYREGGFAVDGTANLGLIATNISMTASNSFSATWTGTLKPKFAKCLASAGMTTVDGKKYEGNTNYLRIHFVKGKVYLMLDLAGASDPNNYPLIVLKKGAKNGNLTWTWGGTD
ncbi:hypothetical protein CK510_04405 [Brunnivagina elsteri CCALA 953]|uniref:Uncharacterized protein n=2 Tax=Brunnivagina TaxID=3344733 RepID=A0A2A2TNL0_9CYAN|nr:hypothetical protein CK510_04405 [Calothrix elsteri CCALA 953]